MEDSQDQLKKIKHVASPSLAIIYEEAFKNKPCMKIDNQNHAECCGCKEPCCAIKMPVTPEQKRENAQQP